MTGRWNVWFVALLVSFAAGCSKTSVAPTPTGPSSPNEPAGLTVVSDWGFDQEPPAVGDVPIPGSPDWSIVFGPPPGPLSGAVRLTADPAAPSSPPGVYDFVYPQGMVEGTAPGTVYYPRGAEGLAARLRLFAKGNDGLGTNEVYVALWWKPSAPFDLGPNGNKIAFLFNGGGDAGGQQFLIMLPDQRLHVLPEYPGDFRWRDPNVNATTVRLGAWHKIEWYSQLSTGTLKWWLDGVLQGSHSDVRNPHDFDIFKLSPTWGGNTGARKRQTDHYWFDHIRISVR
jgi:hypothetical protein